MIKWKGKDMPRWGNPINLGTDPLESGMFRITVILLYLWCNFLQFQLPMVTQSKYIKQK